MDREVIDTWIERTVLSMVLALLAFGTLALGGVRPSEFAVLWWLVVATAVLWAVRIWLAPKFRFLAPPMCWSLLPFVGYAIWRYRTSDVEFIARQELIQILLCALLFIIVVNNLYSQESVRVLCFGLVFLAMFVAIYGIYQWMRASDHVWGFIRPLAYYRRASGSFICPNHLAGLLEMVVPLGITLTVLGRMKVIVRIFLGYASFVGLVGIAATQSRGGWLAIAVSLLILCTLLLRKKGQRWIAAVLLVAVLTTGLWLSSTVVAQRARVTQVTGHERDVRLRLWVSAWQMWKDNLWTGVGPDHFDSRYRQYREPVDKTQARPGRAHNDYLNTLADYGLIGFALLLIPIAVGIGSTIRCWPHLQRGGGEFGQKQSNRTAVVLGASAGLLALSVHSFFDFNLHIPSNAFVAVTLCAIITTHVRFATERYWFTARWPLALAGTAALAGCLYYLGPQAWTRTRELIVLNRAEKLPDGSREKIDLLKRAAVLQPQNFETPLAIGTQLRGLAWAGGDDTELRAEEALDWYRRAIALNKWEVTAYTRAGMCLDWLGKLDEARPYFNKALEIDPNYWETRAMMGWHEFQLDRFAEARDWMLKSRQLNWVNNPLAQTYLDLAEQEIAKENAIRKSRN